MNDIQTERMYWSLFERLEKLEKIVFNSPQFQPSGEKCDHRETKCMTCGVEFPVAKLSPAPEPCEHGFKDSETCPIENPYTPYPKPAPVSPAIEKCLDGESCGEGCGCPDPVEATIKKIIEKWYYGSKPLEYPRMELLEPDLRELVALARKKAG